ncbi:hypothetical protein QAD02_013842 [Eretmocerus hayati]|uniref:Uncharacterized protein n=1 Tax=Eretmocerus hayati TaxID=131215 RepID=A0ACC2P399_9HYME|nr:hypothetical protein QAD02_013842 [Eretmocerus hayati]
MQIDRADEEQHTNAAVAGAFNPPNVAAANNNIVAEQIRNNYIAAEGARRVPNELAGRAATGLAVPVEVNHQITHEGAPQINSQAQARGVPVAFAEQAQVGLVEGVQEAQAARLDPGHFHQGPIRGAGNAPQAEAAVVQGPAPVARGEPYGGTSAGRRRQSQIRSENILRVMRDIGYIAYGRNRRENRNRGNQNENGGQNGNRGGNRGGNGVGIQHN